MAEKDNNLNTSYVEVASHYAHYMNEQMDIRKSTAQSVARFKQKIGTRKAAGGRRYMADMSVNYDDTSQINRLRESMRQGLAATEIGLGSKNNQIDVSQSTRSKRKYSEHSQSHESPLAPGKERSMRYVSPEPEPKTAAVVSNTKRMFSGESMDPNEAIYQEDGRDAKT